MTMLLRRPPSLSPPYQRLTLVRRQGQFAGGLQKRQEGDLLRVVHRRQPVVPQGVGKVPDSVGTLSEAEITLYLIKLFNRDDGHRKNLKG